MWFFVSILFLFGTVHFMLNLALIRKVWIRLAAVLGIAAGTFALYPLSMQINARQFALFLDDYNLLSLACTVQVLESFIMLAAGTVFLKSRVEGGKIPAIGYLSIIPTPILIAGLFMIQTAALYFIDGKSFDWTARTVAVGIFIFFAAGSGVIRFLSKSDELRLDLKFYLSIMQLLLAMFLPVLIRGGTIEATQFDVGVLHSIAVWGSMIVLCIAGYYCSRWNVAESLRLDGFRSKITSKLTARKEILDKGSY
jgi:hypothetical protein